MKKLFVFLFLIFIFTGCNKKQVVQEPVINNSIPTQEDGKQGQVLVDDKKEIDGDVIDLGDGWKNFINKDIGIEFNFFDDKNEIRLESRFSVVTNERGTGQITLENSDKGMFLDIRFDTNEVYDSGEGQNFKDFLIESQLFNFGEIFGQTVTKKYNKNGIEYYEVLTDQLPDRYVGMEEQKREITKNYVIEYKNEKNNMEKLKNNYDYYQYFEFYGDSVLMDEVIESFDF